MKLWFKNLWKLIKKILELKGEISKMNVNWIIFNIVNLIDVYWIYVCYIENKFFILKKLGEFKILLYISLYRKVS